jgi:hypothetical protein
MCALTIGCISYAQGLRGKENVDVFILHPHKRVAPIQEAQVCCSTGEELLKPCLSKFHHCSSRARLLRSLAGQLYSVAIPTYLPFFYADDDHSR